MTRFGGSRAFALGLCAVIACAATTPRPRLRRVDDDERRARLALGAFEDVAPSSAEQRARLRRIAELEAQLGNVEEAAAAVRSRLEAARADRSRWCRTAPGEPAPRGAGARVAGNAPGHGRGETPTPAGRRA